MSPAKTAAPIELPFGLRTKGQIFFGGGRMTAESIGMQFGLWARMGRRNHVLDGGPYVLRDVAMSTNFGTQFAITGFGVLWAITLVV